MRNNLLNNLIEKAKVNILVIGVIFCSTTQILYGTNIWVKPDQIIFDHQGTNGALSMCKNGGQPADIPEWFYSLDRYDSCAYIKDQTDRSIQVVFESNYQGIMHLIVNLSVVSGDGIGSICNFFIPNYNTLVYDSRTLNLTGRLPNAVGKHKFKWKWSIYAIPVNTTSYCAATDTLTTTHVYYTLLGTPNPEAKPWPRVLDLACIWAANKTTEIDALNSITTNAYSYFGSTKTYDYHFTHATGNVFDLTGFFSADHVDCEDMSAVVQVFIWMIGGTATRVVTINDKWGAVENFNHKSIKPIGINDWTGIEWWSFHQVAWLNNVYDACIKIRQDALSEGRIPIDEDINGDYKRDLFVENSGWWLPKPPFYFIAVY